MGMKKDNGNEKNSDILLSGMNLEMLLSTNSYFFSRRYRIRRRIESHSEA